MRAINQLQGKSEGIRNLQYGLRKEVTKIFTISLRLIKCLGKDAFNFSGPYSEIRPAKLTNHSARTN